MYTNTTFFETYTYRCTNFLGFKLNSPNVRFSIDPPIAPKVRHPALAQMVEMRAVSLPNYAHILHVYTYKHRTSSNRTEGSIPKTNPTPPPTSSASHAHC